jgi:V8-like Glu-specific endopeptidase
MHPAILIANEFNPPESRQWEKSVESTTRRGEKLCHDLSIYTGNCGETFIIMDTVNSDTHYRNTWEVGFDRIPDEKIDEILTSDNIRDILNGFNPYIKAGYADED